MLHVFPKSVLSYALLVSFVCPDSDDIFLMIFICECYDSIFMNLSLIFISRLFNFQRLFECFTGVVEKVGDIKTRIQATKCLTTFCEAVGPKFIFERVRSCIFFWSVFSLGPSHLKFPLVDWLIPLMMQLFKIMKDHKNPKVLSEGLSWMMTALDDFGIGHVPLKVVAASSGLIRA